MIDLLFWLAISFLTALVGAALGRLVALRLDAPLTRLAVFVALGYLILAYLLLALGLLGLLRAPAVLALLGILLLVGLSGFRPLSRTLSELCRDIRRAFVSSPARLLYWFLLLWALTRLVSALAPPAGLDWDGLAQHLAMAKEWLAAGRIVPLWYDHHSHFPASLQMLYALGLLFCGPVAAKLFHFGFGIIALAAVFELTRRHICARAAPWAAVILATTPVFSWLMGVAYVDLAVVAYVLLAVHLFLEWVSSRTLQAAALSGVLAGAAMAVKMQGIAYFGVLLLSALYIAWRRRGQQTHSWQAVIAFALLGVLVASPWYLKSWLVTGNPVYPFAYGLFDGKQWSAEQAQWYQRHQLEFGVGELPPQEVLAALPWYQRTFVGPRQPLRLLMAPLNLTFRPASFTDPVGPAAAVMFSSIGPLYLIFVPVLLLGTGRPPKLTLLLILFAPLWVWWLYSMQQSRYLLPTLALLAPVAGYAIHRCTRSPLVLRSTARVAVAAWLIVVMAFNLLPVSSALPGVLGTMPTETYLAWTLAPYPLLDYLNRYAPPEAKVISYGEPRLFYLERDYLWGDPVYHRMIIYDTMKGPGDLLAAYNRLSITHIIYCPALLNRLSADRAPVAPLLKPALEEGYLEPVLGPFAPGHYQLLRVTERGRAP